MPLPFFFSSILRAHTEGVVVTHFPQFAVAVQNLNVDLRNSPSSFNTIGISSCFARVDNQWFCNMNYDRSKSSCDVPEEAWDADDRSHCVVQETAPPFFDLFPIPQ
jgi:hypothetical protein